MTRFFALFALILAAIVFSLNVRADDGKPLAYVLKVEGVISPASKDLISRHLKIAASRKADVVVLEMHTPGGLVDSMQQIVQDILASEVPVATYVSPPGSHAASAGTYILYASHIATMAPGTNIGAATPVQMGGGQPQEQKKEQKEDKNAPPQTNEGALDRKAVNDAAAYIRGLAELRGRNAEWAEKAVREAVSLTASEAMSQKVIDIVAGDIPELLSRMDGRTVKMGGDNKTQKLRTKNAVIERVEGDWRHKILSIITHPNVALLLMSLGFYGLVYEFSNPGALFPGIVGGICLVLGLYALNILPVNYAGLALILAGLAMMTAEAFITSFGILGIAGAVVFVLGATMLIDTGVPGFDLDLWVIGSIAGFSLLILSVLLRMAAGAMRRPRVTGKEELLSATAVVLSWDRGQGEVRVTGEIWRARASGDFIIQSGDRVRILEINGLELVIAPLQ